MEQVAQATEITAVQTGTVAEEQKTETQQAEGEQVTPEQQEAHKQSKFQRRLERQKTARIQAETRAQIAEQERDQLRAQMQEKQAQTGEPKRDQFSDYESYLEARTDWKAANTVETRLKAEREANQGREQQGRQSAADQKVADAWIEREKAFLGTTKDYEEVVSPFVDEDLKTLSPAARRAIVESDVGPQLLYHLATNPDDMERLADLSPARQTAELGKLENKMPVAQRKTTAAPQPPSHVNTGRTGSKDPAKMNPTEYRAWMKANGSRFA